MDLHITCRDGDIWESRSLVFENDQWVLDISCVNLITSGWSIRINDSEYACIELSKIAVPYRGNPMSPLQPEFINKYYINQDGHCVLLRRYMGPVWKEWRRPFWDELQQSAYIEEHGCRFYLYMDYIPKAFL